MDGLLQLAHRQTRLRHAAETLRLAGPLAVAQLAQMAMGLTDTVMLGALGGDALAAGGLGMMLYVSVTILLQGMLTSVSIVVAQARGAGDDGAVAPAYWAGLGMSLLLSVPAWAVFSLSGPLLRAAGQPAELVRDTAAYMDVLRWATPGTMVGIGLMRAYLPAIGQGAVLLYCGSERISSGQVLTSAKVSWPRMRATSRLAVAERWFSAMRATAR